MAVIVGIDEVGRGCWAGPLVVGAVVLDKPILGLADSKSLTKNQRIKLAQQIKSTAAAIGLGWVTAVEVDALGLTQATTVGIRRALQQITLQCDEIIIDGNINYLIEDARAREVVGADSSCPSVSAASIYAKVARDEYMSDMSLKYPEYKFDKHVGYGTKLHLEMLRIHGVSDIHRRSFKPIQVMLG